MKDFIEEKEKSKRVKKSLTKDGMTYEITVEEVEGGFIVTKSMWGDRPLAKPKDGRTSEYISKEKRYVSTTNPFEEKEEKDDFNFSLGSALDAIADMEGSLKIN